LSSLFVDPPHYIDLDIGADGHLSRPYTGSVSRFGTPVCKEVMRYVEVDSMDDLPPLLKTLGSHTKQANDHVTICSAIDIRASKNNCVTNQWSKPVVTSQLLVIFREHHLTATGDNYGEGFTPFTITCAGHPNAKDETAKANRLNLVETGSTGRHLLCRHISVRKGGPSSPHRQPPMRRKVARPQCSSQSLPGC